MFDTAIYTLPDPREIAAGARYTFFLPGAAEIAAVGAGDLVKLMFEYPHDTEQWAGERMWVEIKAAAEGDVLVGSLANQPSEPSTTLAIGDAVRFACHHILAIEWADGAAAPAHVPQRQYWDRCLVDRSVLDGVPVDYLYREAPEEMQEGDAWPDSGWRIRAQPDVAANEDADAETPAYVALGAVLNRDDSWIAWIDAPVGTRLVREEDGSGYRRVEQW